MVEPDQDVRNDEPTFGQARALGGKRHGRFQPSGEVIGEIANDRLSRRLSLGEVAKMAPAPDQRVSPEPAAFDRLEQKGRAAFAAQPQVGTERCYEIGGDVGWDAGSNVAAGRVRKKDLPVEGLVSGTGCSGLAQCRHRLPLRSQRQAQMRVAGVIVASG
jgi:hypothetical protein